MHTPPIPGSGRATIMRRKKIKRIILLASLAVIILLFLTSSILLAVRIAQTAAKLPADNGNDNTEQTTPPPSDTHHTDGNTSGYTAFMVDSAQMKQGALVLVNKDHKYTFPTGVSQLVEIRSSRIKSADGNYAFSCDYDKLLHTEAMQSFNKMMDAFYVATGNGDALVFDAYRTEEQQNGMNTSTKGGYSDHHTGYLVTIKFLIDGRMYDQNEALVATAYTWLAEHAHEYGFVTRYPENKATATGVSGYSNAFRYVGTAHAAYMYQNNLCLEEYVELLKSYDLKGAHLSVTDAQGVKYEIYRIEASTAAQTSVQVPEGKQYTISGDNNGGLIVTVTLN